VDPLDVKSNGLREQQDERLDACLSWAPEILEKMGSRSKTGSVHSSKPPSSSPQVAVKPEAAKPAAPPAAAAADKVESTSSLGKEGGDLSKNEPSEPSVQPVVSTLDKAGSGTSSLAEEPEEEAEAVEEAKKEEAKEEEAKEEEAKGT
jgi:hypothetical protein